MDRRIVVVAAKTASVGGPTALDLIGKILEILYRSEGSLPWRHIFLLHRFTYPFAAHLLMASCKPFHARIRVLAATLPGSSWPFTLDLLDSAFVIYLSSAERRTSSTSASPMTLFHLACS